MKNYESNKRSSIKSKSINNFRYTRQFIFKLNKMTILALNYHSNWLFAASLSLIGPCLIFPLYCNFFDTKNGIIFTFSTALKELKYQFYKMTELATKNAITLKGSAKMIQEFFNYGIHSILYQRGIYAPDNFTRKKIRDDIAYQPGLVKLGLLKFSLKDPKVQKFLQPLLEHVKELLAAKKLKKLVLVLKDIATKEALERWQFDIETTENIDENGSICKEEKRIKQEISDVLRQITASVAFLPFLESQCSFDVLIYTFKDTEMPEGWADSTECQIKDAEQVQLRSFSTAVHNVLTKVQYKTDL